LSWVHLTSLKAEELLDAVLFPCMVGLYHVGFIIGIYLQQVLGRCSGFPGIERVL